MNPSYTGTLNILNGGGAIGAFPPGIDVSFDRSIRF